MYYLVWENRGVKAYSKNFKPNIKKQKLQEGGPRKQDRRTELTMIMEAKRERMRKYLERQNDRKRKENDETTDNGSRTEREIIKEIKEDG